MPTHYDADLRLFINGSWRIGEGRDASGVINPATGETIAELPLATAADLDEALASADKGFQTWRRTPAIERAKTLRRAAALMRERAEAIAKGRKPLGGDPSKGYGNVNSTDLNELGRFGVEGNRLPELVATGSCPWVAGARSEAVRKILGRAGVEGRDWHGSEAIPDQIAIGVWNLRRHLDAIRKRIDPRLAWPEGDKPVTAWAYSLAMMSWSAGSGGASKHVNAYADELAALPEAKRWGAFMRLAARDDSDARKHRADEYSALRTEQKRRAGVLACTFTGEDAAWFDDGLTDAERDEVHAALVRVSK